MSFITKVQQYLQNIGEKNPNLSSRLLSLEKSPFQNKDVQTYVQNRYVEPIKQLPRSFVNVFKTAVLGRPTTPQEFGKNIMGTMSGAATLLPDPIGDIALPAYDFLKGAKKGFDEKKSVKDILQRGVKSMTLEEPVGLGEAAVSNKHPFLQQAGNLAEIPLVMLAAGKAPQAIKKAGNIGDILAKKNIPQKSIVNVWEETANKVLNRMESLSKNRKTIFNRDYGMKGLVNQLERQGEDISLKQMNKFLEDRDINKLITKFWKYTGQPEPGDYRVKPGVLEGLEKTKQVENMAKETAMLEQNPVPLNLGKSEQPLEGKIYSVKRKPGEYPLKEEATIQELKNGGFYPDLEAKKMGVLDFEINPEKYNIEAKDILFNQLSQPLEKKFIEKYGQPEFQKWFDNFRRNNKNIDDEIYYQTYISDLQKSLQQPQIIPKQVEQTPQVIPEPQKPIVEPVQGGNLLSKILETKNQNELKGQEKFNVVTDYLNSKLEELNTFAKANNVDLVDVAKSLDDNHKLSSEGQVAKTKIKNLQDEIYDVLNANKEIPYREGFTKSWFNEEDEVYKYIDSANSPITQYLSPHRQQRTGTGTGYIENPIESFRVSGQSAIAEHFKPEISAQKRNIPVEVVMEEKKIADVLDDFAKKAETEMSLGEATGQEYKIDTSKMFRDLAEKEAKITGKEPPVIKDHKNNINVLEYTLIDGWSNLKKSGIYQEAFEKLDTASNRAAYIVYENFIKNKFIDNASPGQITLALRRLGLNVDEIPYFMQTINKKIKDKSALASFIQNSFYKLYKGEGEQILVDWMKTNRTHGLLENLVNYHSAQLLTRDRVMQTMTDKIVNFFTRRYASGALGLSPTAIMNNLIEGKRAFSINSKVAVEAYAYMLKHPGEMRRKYGITNDYISQFLNEQKNKDVKGLLEKANQGLTKTDDFVMKPFQWSEGLKDDVFLYMGEKLAQINKIPEEQRFSYVMDFFQKYAHKFGQMGTVGMFNNKWVKLGLQFAQYTLKDWGVGYQMFSNLFKGNNKTKIDSAKYLVKMGIANVFLWGLLDKLYNAPFESRLSQTFGNMPGPGPLITTITNSVNSYLAEKREAELENRDFSIENMLKGSKVGRDLSLLLPAGNQLINRTLGGVKSIARGYEQSPSGNIRFMSPQLSDIPNTTRAVIFGPNSTNQAGEYWDNRSKGYSTLGKIQSNEIKNALASGNQQAGINIFNNIRTQQKEGKDFKKTINDMLKGKSVNPQQTIIDTSTMQFNLANESDVVLKDSIDDKNKKMIQDILFGEDTRGIDEPTKLDILKKMGATEKMIEDAKNSKLAGLDVIDRAEMIAAQIKSGSVDLVNLYKNKILTSSVADELERMGIIDDADALIKKLKLTDVYYQREAARSASKKTASEQKAIIKKYMNLQESHMKKLLSEVKQLSSTKKIKSYSSPTISKLLSIKAPKMV